MAKIKEQVAHALLTIAQKIAKWVYNDSNRVVEAMKILCVGCTLLAGLTLINMSKDMVDREAMYSNVKQGLYAISDKYRHAVVQDGYRTAELHSRVLRNLITTRIQTEYAGDTDKLRNDLTTYVTTNDMQNPLFRIFSEEAFNYERAWVASDAGFRIIVTDRRNVLFSTYAKEPLRNNENAMPDIIFTKPHGKMLIFNEETKELKAVYTGILAEKIDKLHHIRVLAPSYIFEHEDLLGVRDVYPDGTPAVNYKLAVIVAYEPLNDKSTTILKNMDTVIQASKDEDQWIIIRDGTFWTAVWGISACLFGFVWYISINHKTQK